MLVRMRVLECQYTYVFNLEDSAERAGAVALPVAEAPVPVCLDDGGLLLAARGVDPAVAGLPGGEAGPVVAGAAPAEVALAHVEAPLDEVQVVVLRGLVVDVGADRPRVQDALAHHALREVLKCFSKQIELHWRYIAHEKLLGCASACR